MDNAHHAAAGARKRPPERSRSESHAGALSCPAETASLQSGQTRPLPLHWVGARKASPDMAGGTGAGGMGTESAALGRAIETEIIPRLVLAHSLPRRAATPARPVPADYKASAADIEAIAELAMRGQDDALAAYVSQLRDRGFSRESILLDILAPAARHLGDLWVQDRCDFLDVTVGLTRLQSVLHDLSSRFGNGRDPGPRRIMLLPAPGERHTFGISVVEEFFREAGWDVTGAPLVDKVAAVKRDWFGVVGFSLSSEVNLPALASLIRSIRRASRNPGIAIMVGGPVFLAKPELVGIVGADVTAENAPAAVVMAHSLLDIRAQAC